MEQRLIDAFALISDMEDKCCGECDLCIYSRYENACYFCGLIEEAPTVERPHGKWIKEDKPWGGFGDHVLVNTCPFCKESFVYHGNNPKFCPECGAEMKEDEV